MLPRPTDERPRSRPTFVDTLLGSGPLVLLDRPRFVQIVVDERYPALPERGRMRAVADEAPRRIPDRLGRVLVDSRQVPVIGVRLDEMGSAVAPCYTISPRSSG